ncbi:MAG: hypothetical protein U0I22_07135 [Treponema sp.]|nr:hypothetical protein [Treponema sp.]
MKNSWESKKILAYGKRFSVFTSIMLVLLFAFSCSNLIMNDGGSLIIAVPGARAASASSYTIELTGTNGTTQSKTVAGGTTAQFDDLDPDTYNISVKGTNADVVVLYGTSSATVSAGATASATVKMGVVANDLSSLRQAITAGGTVYIGSDINVDSTLTVNTDVTLLPAYKNVTLKKTADFDLISVTAGKLTVGGNDYTITLDGNSEVYNTSTKNLIKVNGAGSTIYLNRNSVVMNNAGTGVSITGANALDSGKAFGYLNGGTISNNKSGGVGLSSYVEFVMNSGSIENNTYDSRSGAAVNMSTSNTSFVMKGGTITGNTVTGTTPTNGGAINATAGSSFTMEGGIIINNTTTGQGKGVYFAGSGSLKIGGSAVIDTSNDVYFSSSYKLSIISTLTGASTVATITPVTYSAGTQVLQAENGVDLAAMVKKFKVTPNGDEEWTIKDDGTLMKDEGF